VSLHQSLGVADLEIAANYPHSLYTRHLPLNSAGNAAIGLMSPFKQVIENMRSSRPRIDSLI
jgi:hypothetical protein